MRDVENLNKINASSNCGYNRFLFPLTLGPAIADRVTKDRNLFLYLSILINGAYTFTRIKNYHTLFKITLLKVLRS